MVPPVTVHSSVPLAVVVAVLPVELAQTELAVLIEGVGGLSLTVTTVASEVALQPAALVTWPAELPEVLTVGSEDGRVGCAPVMVPPVTVHSSVPLAVVVAVL